MNVNLITVEEYIQLSKKLESLEKKVDSLNGGIGSKSLYTILEACALLQVSKRTLQKYRDEGMIPFTQVRSKIYFRDTDIEEFLAKHKVEPYTMKGGSHGEWCK